jgi:hypothetical protein
MARTTMTDKPQDLIAEARRLNHEAQAIIDRLLDTAKPVRAPRQRSAKARIRAVVEAARAVGMDPQIVEVDGVKVSAARLDPDDAAATAFETWKARKNAHQA